MAGRGKMVSLVRVINPYCQHAPSMTRCFLALFHEFPHTYLCVVQQQLPSPKILPEISQPVRRTTSPQRPSGTPPVAPPIIPLPPRPKPEGVVDTLKEEAEALDHAQLQASMLPSL